MKKLDSPQISHRSKFSAKQSPFSLQKDKDRFNSPYRKSPVGRSIYKTQYLTETDIEPITFERVLFEQLVDLTALILKSKSSHSGHDMKLLEQHIRSRALESVDEDLAHLIAKLNVLQGHNNSHRITAYSQLLGRAMDEMDSVVFNEDKRKLHAAKNDHMSTKVENGRIQEQLSIKIAQNEQRIATLESANAALDAKNQTLIRTVDLLHMELGKATAALGDAQQRGVELRMQGWDLKGEVTRRCDKVLESVQSRMGFVPAGIHKQISALQALKPPGDPAYDKSRTSAARKGLRSTSKRASDGGLRGSTLSGIAGEDFFSAYFNKSGVSSNLDSTEAKQNRQFLNADLPFPVSLTRARSDSALAASGGSTGARALEFNKAGFEAFLSSVAAAQQNRHGERLSTGDAHSEYLASLDYLPSPAGSQSYAVANAGAITSTAGPHLLDHRRLSSSSSASGVTDRRSSTSSAMGAPTALHAVSTSLENDQLYTYYNREETTLATGPGNEDVLDAMAVEDDENSATRAVSQHALSTGLRKRWSFDNVQLLQGVGDSGDFSTTSLSQHPRVTTTMAAVPVSASSDMLDDYQGTPADGAALAASSGSDEGSQKLLSGIASYDTKHNRRYTASPPEAGETAQRFSPSQQLHSQQYDEFVDLDPIMPEEDGDQQTFPPQQQNTQQSGIPPSVQQQHASSGRPSNGRAAGVGERLDKSGTIHQQLTLRDSAGAMALRKAGTVSPKARQQKRPSSSAAAVRNSTDAVGSSRLSSIGRISM